jgi:hypothetical protein
MAMQHSVKFRKNRSTDITEVAEGDAEDPPPSPPREAAALKSKKALSREFRQCCNPHIYKESNHRSTAFWLFVTMFALLETLSSSNKVPSSYNFFSISRKVPPFEIIFPTNTTINNNTRHGKNLLVLVNQVGIFDLDGDDDDDDDASRKKPDYGEIDYTLNNNTPPDAGPKERYEKYRSDLLHTVDNNNNEEEIPKRYWSDQDREDEEQRCRPVSWRSRIFPNCNTVHEVLLERVINSRREQDYNVTYLLRCASI